MPLYSIPVPGHQKLGPRNLAVNEQVTLSFTADTGLIQVIADGFDLKQTNLTLQPGGDGPPDPPIPEHVRIEVGLIPPGSSVPAVHKVFNRNRLFSEGDLDPLKYDVDDNETGPGWRCTFRNVGRTDIRFYGQLDYVASHATSPISWLPNALAPVFWGYEDRSGTGSPTPMRILFPTIDGSTQNASVLQIEHQYPLIVLCHGNCPGDPNHYLDWAQDVIAIQLARAGCVVLVPHLTGISSGNSPVNSDNDLELVQSVISWMRSQWSHADVIASEPNTAILGHSWGALLAGRLVSAGGFHAYASMSGEWSDWFNDLGDVLSTITVPGLYIWGSGLDVAPLADPQWSEVIHKPRHKAIVDKMDHFDYLPAGVTPCEAKRGPCPHYRFMMADVLTMFIAKYAPPPTLPDLPSKIPFTLVPPSLQLTAEQEYYAGGYLNGFNAVGGDPPECQVTLSYDIGNSSGSVIER